MNAFLDSVYAYTFSPTDKTAVNVLLYIFRFDSIFSYGKGFKDEKNAFVADLSSDRALTAQLRKKKKKKKKLVTLNSS